MKTNPAVTNHHWLKLVIVATGLALVSTNGSAQTYPARPVIR